MHFRLGYNRPCCALIAASTVAFAIFSLKRNAESPFLQSTVSWTARTVESTETTASAAMDTSTAADGIVATKSSRNTLRVQDRDNVESNWSFPFTRFSTHVTQLVQSVDLALSGTHCSQKLEVTVSSPYTLPTVHLRSEDNNPVGTWWMSLLRERVFSEVRMKERVVPGNVTFGISEGDWHDPEIHGYGCFGSSGPDGAFAVTNFLEIKRMAENRTYLPTLPWEERRKIPVWRGTPWNHLPQGYDRQAENKTHVLLDILDHSIGMKEQRVPLVVFSHAHPDLIDARISTSMGIAQSLWDLNATNGLDKLLPMTTIPPDRYYTEYQVAVVMGGIGAAFRTPIHLSTGTAIVLQDYDYEEWYVKLMDPFVHYIPLARDMSDLHERMSWVRDNPDKVREIARNGQQFYEEYLSFDRTEEFIYELVYRLALKASNLTESV